MGRCWQGDGCNEHLWRPWYLVLVVVVPYRKSHAGVAHCSRSKAGHFECYRVSLSALQGSGKSNLHFNTGGGHVPCQVTEWQFHSWCPEGRAPRDHSWHPLNRLASGHRPGKIYGPAYPIHSCLSVASLLTARFADVCEHQCALLLLDDGS